MLIAVSLVSGGGACDRAAGSQDGMEAAVLAAPEQLGPPYSPEPLVQRLMEIFLLGKESPCASAQKRRVASEAWLDLVVAADVARTRFWLAHEDDVTQACPFLDRKSVV